jgi:hypothetical protein
MAQWIFSRANLTVGSAEVAYQVSGDGPEDLVFCDALSHQMVELRP